MLFSSSECITWFAVFLTVCVPIVTVNLISIILFIKNRSLRTHAMYLVINLTVADMFVGGFSHFLLFQHLSDTCDIMKMNLSPELIVIVTFLHLWFPLRLSNKHCSYFIRSVACNNSSLQASPHQKVGLRGNNCWCLGFSCNGNCHVLNSTTSI